MLSGSIVSVLIVNFFSEASLFDKRAFSLLQTSLLRGRDMIKAKESCPIASITPMSILGRDLATFTSPAPGTLFTAL
jgi:hypothetical protein